MMSSGRRELMKVTSVPGAQSASQRAHRHSGVMPEPAEMNRYLDAAAGADVIEHPVPMLLSCALMVMMA
jgi:hypothetical protein